MLVRGTGRSVVSERDVGELAIDKLEMGMSQEQYLGKHRAALVRRSLVPAVLLETHSNPSLYSKQFN